MTEYRSFCPGSRQWPDGTVYPSDPNSPGYALCGTCGKRVSCTRSPNRYMPVGMLRAHRLPKVAAT